jgi:hypothetical protein
VGSGEGRSGRCDDLAATSTRFRAALCLAPEIVVAILNSRQPVSLTARKLMADTRAPPVWSEQRKALGFA